MRAGNLRHQLILEAPTVTQNEFGEPIESWATVAVVWASKEDLAGREYFAAQQINSEVTTRFRLRYMVGVTTKMRVHCEGAVYDVLSVQDPDGRCRELILMCSKTASTAAISLVSRTAMNAII